MNDIVVPGKGAEQQGLDLARAMLEFAAIRIGARVRGMGLPFRAVYHGGPVQADVFGLVCREVGGENLFPLHVGSAWVFSPKRLVDPREVLHGGVRRHPVAYDVDGLGVRRGNAGGGPVDGRSVRLGDAGGGPVDGRSARLGFVGCWPLCVGPWPGLKPWWPPSSSSRRSMEVEWRTEAVETPLSGLAFFFRRLI